MNNETYEQIDLIKEMVDNSQFLKEGQDVEALFHAEKEARRKSRTLKIQNTIWQATLRMEQW